jgi:hypothetical protein
MLKQFQALGICVEANEDMEAIKKLIKEIEEVEGFVSDKAKEYGGVSAEGAGAVKELEGRPTNMSDVDALSGDAEVTGSGMGAGETDTDAIERVIQGEAKKKFTVDKASGRRTLRDTEGLTRDADPVSPQFYGYISFNYYPLGRTSSSCSPMHALCQRRNTVHGDLSKEV